MKKLIMILGCIAEMCVGIMLTVDAYNRSEEK